MAVLSFNFIVTSVALGAFKQLVYFVCVWRVGGLCVRALENGPAVKVWKFHCALTIVVLKTFQHVHQLCLTCKNFYWVLVYISQN